MKKWVKWTSWIMQIIVAAILLQSLYFKFTSQPVSVELFTTLGVEPWGRYLVALIELATGILLLIPNTVFIGAILATIIGLGAILTHIFSIGIYYDGNITLFLLALVIFIFGIALIFMRKKKTENKEIINNVKANNLPKINMNQKPVQNQQVKVSRKAMVTQKRFA